MFNSLGCCNLNVVQHNVMSSYVLQRIDDGFGQHVGARDGHRRSCEAPRAGRALAELRGRGDRVPPAQVRRCQVRAQSKVSVVHRLILASLPQQTCPSRNAWIILGHHKSTGGHILPELPHNLSSA